MGQPIGKRQLPVSAQIHLLDELMVTVGKSGTTVWNGANQHELVFRGQKYLSCKGRGFGADVTKENAAAGAHKLMMEELGPMTLGEIAIEHDD